MTEIFQGLPSDICLLNFKKTLLVARMQCSFERTSIGEQHKNLTLPQKMHYRGDCFVLFKFKITTSGPAHNVYTLGFILVCSRWRCLGD